MSPPDMQAVTNALRRELGVSEDNRSQEHRQGGDVPRLLGDRYDLIEVVGAGATAITWRAHDRRLDRPVAIKVLRRDGEQDPNYSQRFEREARISASISDAHVVQVFDVGQQDGWLYLVMQFVDGEDLKHLITRRGALSANRARDIALQMLDGLAAIHRAGILHRDIKSQNVLIDRDGKVRVTDFGIAQTSLDPGLTSAGMAVGTAAYMAPEQAEAKPLSEATDIYAAGVVLYEMLTGRLPFERPTATATMLAHMQEPPTPPSVAAPEAGIPPMLDAVVMQAMAKNPVHRFRSAAAMSRALEGNLADPGATTRIAPPPPAQTTRVAPATRQPVRQTPPSNRPPTSPLPPASSGGGGRGALNFVLIIILLAMVAVLAYLASELLNDRENPPNQPTATATATTEPEATDAPDIAPEPTDDPGQIIEPPAGETEPPAAPTNEPPPTNTPEPTPTNTPEPPLEPTVEPTIPIIEPADQERDEPGT